MKSIGTEGMFNTNDVDYDSLGKSPKGKDKKQVKIQEDTLENLESALIKIQSDKNVWKKSKTTSKKSGELSFYPQSKEDASDEKDEENDNKNQPADEL